MEELTPFFRFLNNFLPLSQEEFETYLKPFTMLRRFDEKQIVTAIGAVENHFNFLLRGLVRTYSLKAGKEVVVQLTTPGHIVQAQESFYNRMPSTHCIETIEPSLFASITHHDLETVYSSCNKMQHLGRLLVTHTLLLKEKMQAQLTMLSPRERFLHFMDCYPALLKRVPQKYIASYLNIKPETFSRFKQMRRSNMI